MKYPSTPPSAPLPEALLTVPDVAHRLNIAKTSVYDLIANRQLAHVRIGRLVRVREPDLATFLADAHVHAAPAPHPYGRYPKT